MRTLLIVTTFFLTLFSTQELVAQKAKKTETIIIKTSAQCGMCKQTLEKAMAYEKGVVSSTLTVKTAELAVTYKPSKTTPEKIRTAITETGYDADDKSANSKAYEKLPDCCKKGGMDH